MKRKPFLILLLLWGPCLTGLLGLDRQSAEAREFAIETIAGSGQSALGPHGAPLQTALGNPFGVAVDRHGSLYICEVTNHRLWRLDSSRGELSVVAGTGQAGYTGDGAAAVEARMNEPYEVRVDGDGNLYVVEMQNHVVRRIDADSGRIDTVAGTGQPGFSGDGGLARAAQLKQPHSIALDDRGNLYIADIGNHRIRRVDLARGTIESFAGTEAARLPTDGQLVTGTPVLGPRALDYRDGILWVALREGHSVWRIPLDQPVWQHVAGTGQRGYAGDGGLAALALFDGPKGLAVDARHNLWVVDTENQAIRRIEGTSRIIATAAGLGPHHRGFAGDGGPARQAQLNRPHGICLDLQGNVIIGDSENHRVRRLTAAP